MVTDPAHADELLAELSGVPTEGFFRSTASVRHHELAGLQRDESALRDRLQASISGADRGTSRAKKQLERALQGLRASGAKNPGRIKVAEEAVADVTASLRRARRGSPASSGTGTRMSLARERRSETEKALTERRALLEKARQAERLTTERERRAGALRALPQRRDRARRAHRPRGQPPVATPLAVLRPAVERLRGLETKIATLEAQLEGEIQVSFEVPPEPRWQPLSRMAVLLAAIGVVVAAVGFVLNLPGILELGSLLPLLGGLIAVVGVAFGLAAAWLRRGDRVQKQLRDVEVDRRLRGRSEIEQDLKMTQAERASELDALGLEHTEEAEDQLRAEEAHVADIDQHLARLAGLVGEEPRERLPERRDTAALEIEQKTAALEALGPIAKEPRARERLEVEVADAERAAGAGSRRRGRRPGPR